MNLKTRFIILAASLLLAPLYGCQTAVQKTFPPSTEIQPTNTSIQPSATPAPTNTPVPLPTKAPSDTPTSPPPIITAQPERPVDSIDELIGIWKGNWSTTTSILLEFKANMESLQSTTNGDFAGSEWYDFKDGMLTWGKMIKPMNAATVCIDNPEATYEVYIIFRDDQPEKLRFVLIGEDQCIDRRDFLDGQTLRWVEP